MKKTIFIALVIMGSPGFNIKAQDVPIIGNRIVAGIDGGLALPGGDLKSTNITYPSNYNSGFAQTGFGWDVYGGFRFISILGAMVLVGGNTQAFNTSEYQSATNSSSVAVNSKYNIGEYLIGPYLSFPKLILVKVEVHALFGVYTANYPNVTFSNGFSTFSEAYNSGSGIGYNIGGKVKYNIIGKILSAAFGLNFCGAAVKYSGGNSTALGVSTPISSFKMNVGEFQATLGLALDI
jgi:hypothetical protein